jgi:hypothetical protein
MRAWRQAAMRAQRCAGKKRGRGEEAGAAAGGVERALQRWRESGREAAGTAGAVGRAAGESGTGAAALVMLQLFTAGVFVVLVDLHERGRRSSGGRRAAGNYDGARGLVGEQRGDKCGCGAVAGGRRQPLRRCGAPPPLPPASSPPLKTRLMGSSSSLPSPGGERWRGGACNRRRRAGRPWRPSCRRGERAGRASLASL